MSEHPQIAKITQPRLQVVLPRQRLFSLLDRGRNVSVTWVMGTGSTRKALLVTQTSLYVVIKIHSKGLNVGLLQAVQKTTLGWSPESQPNPQEFTLGNR